MPESSLVKKLLVKPDNRVLLLNAPAGYPGLLGELPPGTTLDENPSGQYELVQAFVKSKAEAEALWPVAVAAAKAPVRCFPVRAVWPRRQWSRTGGIFRGR